MSHKLNAAPTSLLGSLAYIASPASQLRAQAVATPLFAAENSLARDVRPLSAANFEVPEGGANLHAPSARQEVPQLDAHENDRVFSTLDRTTHATGFANRDHAHENGFHNTTAPADHMHNHRMPNDPHMWANHVDTAVPVDITPTGNLTQAPNFQGSNLTLSGLWDGVRQAGVVIQTQAGHEICFMLSPTDQTSLSVTLATGAHLRGDQISDLTLPDGTQIMSFPDEAKVIVVSNTASTDPGLISVKQSADDNGLDVNITGDFTNPRMM